MTALASPRRPGAPRGGAPHPHPPLVAVAHGSSDPRAGAVVRELVRRAALRVQPVGSLRVEDAYLDHAGPRLPEVLHALAADGAGEVVVLPLLLTAAYHSSVDIPRELAAAGAELPELTVRYAATLGPHPQLVAAMERRLAEAGVAPGDPDTAVVLAAAGSSDRAAIATIEDLARRWRRRGWWDVVPAYASATGPTAEEAVRSLRAAGAPKVAVASYLLGPGLLPDRVAAGARAAGADAVAEVLGAADEVVTVMLDRMSEVRAFDRQRRR